MAKAYYALAGNPHIPKLPVNLQVSPNFPNPFNQSTKIRFKLDAPAIIEISIYNIIGEQIDKLILGNKEMGIIHEVEIPLPSGTASGIYFYRIKVRNLQNGNIEIQTGKMVFTK